MNIFGSHEILYSSSGSQQKMLHKLWEKQKKEAPRCCQCFDTKLHTEWSYAGYVY